MAGVLEMDGTSDEVHEPSDYFILSGGTAFNHYVEALSEQTSRVAYCLPVSDNGLILYPSDRGLNKPRRIDSRDYEGPRGASHW